MLIGGSSVSNYLSAGNYGTLNSWFETSSGSLASSLESMVLLGSNSSLSSSNLESTLLGTTSTTGNATSTSELYMSLGYSSSAKSLLNLSAGSILDTLG